MADNGVLLGILMPGNVYVEEWITHRLCACVRLQSVFYEVLIVCIMLQLSSDSFFALTNVSCFLFSFFVLFLSILSVCTSTIPLCACVCMRVWQGESGDQSCCSRADVDAIGQSFKVMYIETTTLDRYYAETVLTGCVKNQDWTPEIH